MFIKKIALFFCFLCPLFICSCLDYVEYTFINKSSYTVIISLSEVYKNESSTDAPYLSDRFSVYQKETVKKYTSNNEVDFTWTTYNTGDSSKVSCEVTGSKATFTNR